MTTASSRSLRTALLADAGISGAAGLLMALAAGPLSNLLAIPSALLFWAGIICIASAALMAFTGTREPVPSALAWLIVVGNVGWVLASIALAAGIIKPNALGVAFILAQAATVAWLTWMEYAGLKQSPASA